MGVRVYKLAEDLGIDSKELLKKLEELSIDVKSHMSSLDEETAEIVLEELKGTESIEKLKQEKQEREAKPILEIEFPITVKQFSKKIPLKTSEFMQKLMSMGILANINQTLDRQTLNRVAEDLGYDIKEAPTHEEKLIERHKKESPEKLSLRSPVITLMGHVDHGKTSLLDVIKKSDLTRGEAGGITQHIGAYKIKVEKGEITFLDTPGHEAFTSLRARGAHVTDLVILVVAADDGIMPQTIEAIDHAKAAQVPMIVAINKIDKPNAQSEEVKKQLSEHDLTPEDWGGKTITVEVSAKTGENVDSLLDMVLLEAELLELKANYDKPAQGIVVEAELSKGKGALATVLVQNGTLKKGDVIVAGKFYGKIKALINDVGKRIKKAPPSTPVEVLGLSGVPLGGEKFYVVKDESVGKAIVGERTSGEEQQVTSGIKHISLEDLYDQIKEGSVSQLNLIIKADVQGSLEVLIDSIEKISTDEVKINIIHKGVGLIKESDVMLAAASNAVIFGFHVKANVKARDCAKREGVEIREYDIIYKAMEDIKASIEGMLEPEEQIEDLGTAEVREVFEVSKAGKIAGCYVTDGKVVRNVLCKVIRGGEEIYESRISSLKRFKNDATEVKKDYECGLNVKGFDDLEKGDIIKVYKIKKIPRKL